MADSAKIRPLSCFEELDQQWIELMLSIKFGIPIVVHSWRLTLPKGREGFLSEIAFLKILYSKHESEQHNLQLVLKLLPKDPAIKQFMANGGLAEREVEFYKFVSTHELQNICVLSNLVLPVPEIYFSKFEENAISIILRDLNMDRCKSLIVKEGSTLHQTKVALRAVSQVHAAGYIYIKKHTKENEALKILSSEFSTEFYDQFMNSNLEKIVEMTKGTLVSEKLKALIPVSQSMFTYHKRYPLINTITHGDLWAGQMLYTEDETNAFVIDWQFCRIDNLVIDIVAMFFMSSNPKILEDHMDELLVCYWESFIKPIQSSGFSLDVNFEQFKTNVDDLLIFGFAILAVSIHDFLGAGNLTKDRLLGAVNFVETKGAFSKFLELMEI